MFQWQDDDIDEGMLLEHMDFQDLPPQTCAKPAVSHERAPIVDDKVKNTAVLNSERAPESGIIASVHSNAKNVADDANVYEGNARKKPRLNTHCSTDGSNNISITNNSSCSSVTNSLSVSQSFLPTNSTFQGQKSQNDSALGDSNTSFGNRTCELAPERQIVSQDQMDSSSANVARSSNQMHMQKWAQKPKLGKSMRAPKYTTHRSQTCIDV